MLPHNVHALLALVDPVGDALNLLQRLLQLCVLGIGRVRALDDRLQKQRILEHTLHRLD